MPLEQSPFEQSPFWDGELRWIEPGIYVAHVRTSISGERRWDRVILKGRSGQWSAWLEGMCPIGISAGGRTRLTAMRALLERL